LAMENAKTKDMKIKAMPSKRVVFIVRLIIQNIQENKN
jgi:hypothetical protein